MSRRLVAVYGGAGAEEAARAMADRTPGAVAVRAPDEPGSERECWHVVRSAEPPRPGLATGADEARPGGHARKKISGARSVRPDARGSDHEARATP